MKISDGCSGFEIGQHLNLKAARIVRIEAAEAIYGPISIIVFKDKAGRMYKWVTETKPRWASRWNLVSTRATVKATKEDELIEIKRVALAR